MWLLWEQTLVKLIFFSLSDMRLRFFDMDVFNILFLPRVIVSNNRRWIRDIEELQSVKFNLPLVSDIGCNVLKKVCFI
jgi:hypothetical protein